MASESVLVFLFLSTPAIKKTHLFLPGPQQKGSEGPDLQLLQPYQSLKTAAIGTDLDDRLLSSGFNHLLPDPGRRCALLPPTAPGMLG